MCTILTLWVAFLPLSQREDDIDGVNEYVALGVVGMMSGCILMSIAVVFLRRWSLGRVIAKMLCRDPSFCTALSLWVGKDQLVTLPKQQQQLATRKVCRCRSSSSRTTARDVHKLVIKPATHDLMCRYVELSGVGDGTDRANGRPFVSTADYFLSYEWDVPWQSVVASISEHSETLELHGKPAAYYWIDIFAVNQHLSLKPWTCTSGLGGLTGGCPGCLAAHPKSSLSDMHDWESADPVNPKGFERVIRATRHTLALMSPWDNPGPVKRVWCLFEDYTTLNLPEGVGELDFIMPRVEQAAMQKRLGEEFESLERIVNAIDAREAEATVLTDRDKIFEAIQRLPGRFHGLNTQLRTSMLNWLAGNASDLILRIDSLSQAHVPHNPGGRDALTMWLHSTPQAAIICRVAASVVLIGGLLLWFDVWLPLDDGFREIHVFQLDFAAVILTVLFLACAATALLLYTHASRQSLRLDPLLSSKWFFRNHEILIGVTFYAIPVLLAVWWWDKRYPVCQNLMCRPSVATIFYQIYLTTVGAGLVVWMATDFKLVSRSLELGVKTASLWSLIGTVQASEKALKLLRRVHAHALNMLGRDSLLAYDGAAMLVHHLHLAADRANASEDPASEAELRQEAQKILDEVALAMERNTKATLRNWIHFFFSTSGRGHVLYPSVKISPLDWMWLLATVRTAAHCQENSLPPSVCKPYSSKVAIQKHVGGHGIPFDFRRDVTEHERDTSSNGMYWLSLAVSWGFLILLVEIFTHSVPLYSFECARHEDCNEDPYSYCTRTNRCRSCSDMSYMTWRRCPLPCDSIDGKCCQGPTLDRCNATFPECCGNDQDLYLHKTGVCGCSDSRRGPSGYPSASAYPWVTCPRGTAPSTSLRISGAGTASINGLYHETVELPCRIGADVCKRMRVVGDTWRTSETACGFEDHVHGREYRPPWSFNPCTKRYTNADKSVMLFNAAGELPFEKYETKHWQGLWLIAGCRSGNQTFDGCTGKSIIFYTTCELWWGDGGSQTPSPLFPPLTNWSAGQIASIYSLGGIYCGGVGERAGTVQGQTPAPRLEWV